MGDCKGEGLDPVVHSSAPRSPVRSAAVDLLAFVLTVTKFPAATLRPPLDRSSQLPLETDCLGSSD